MSIVSIEQRLAALEQDVSALKRHMDGSSNPWLRVAGILDKDDPVVKEWVEIMKENRRKADADADYL